MLHEIRENVLTGVLLLRMGLELRTLNLLHLREEDVQFQMLSQIESVTLIKSFSLYYRNPLSLRSLGYLGKIRC